VRVIGPRSGRDEAHGPHLMDTRLRDAVLSGGYAQGQTVAR
jgi:hypothetical protein